MGAVNFKDMFVMNTQLRVGKDESSKDFSCLCNVRLVFMAYHVEKEENNGGLAEIIRVLFMGSSCTVYQAELLEERQAAEGYNYDSFYQMICNYIYYYIF